MSIVFNSLGDTVRLGFTYTEFDGTGVGDDASLNPFTCLLIGQKLAGGSATPFTLERPMSEKQAHELFGQGSMLARMVGKYLKANPVTTMYAMALDDDKAGEKARAILHMEGEVTGANPVCLYIGGQLVRVAARFGDRAADVAAALRDAVNANPELPVTAKSEDASLVLESRHAGEVGNDIDVRLNYKGEAAPDGLTFTLTP